MARSGQTFYTLICAALLFGCSEAEPQDKPENTDPIPAATSLVQSASDVQLISAAGTIRLRRETELGFTTAGQVASVRFEEGDRVKRGATLAALDTSLVAADLASANAEQDRAEAEYARIQKLYSDGWVTKARLEQSESSTRAARAGVESASFASRTSQIRAPSDGIILTRNIDAGQIVAAGVTAIILGETDKGFVLRVPMSDADASRIRIGMPAAVKIAAISNDPIEAVVSEKDGRADPRTGSFEVSFLLPAHSRLRSGQLGSVEIQLPRVDSGDISIPATALFGLRSGEGLVFVVDENNRVKQRNVIIGSVSDEALQIRSGLAQGETIVTRGVEKLRDGYLIKPTRADK
ncbi:efflux RND transporter periplasmic adaptor subunit [Parasphingorhabdus sp.]|uniref:efflux RND transporter periplasmic adaptor subunit n=1 Tax=Parasphingorhabdus sp. TaxID=2709688 RepID=UPI0007F32DE7|nr:hypothetical protein A8B75_04945 [Sphingomonadales bacterium EhC05]